MCRTSGDVSYYKWGGSCPKNLIFNHEHYRNGKCSYADYRFWQSWHSHGEQGKLCRKWYDFSVAYSWWIHQSQLRSFVNSHRGQGWCFETDGSGTHEFDENMKFTTRRGNHQQTVKDGHHPLQDSSINHKKAVSRGRRVIVFKDGQYLSTEFGTREVARVYGVTAATVCDCCHSKFGSHTVQRGPYKGYSFYWEDEYKED